jgi:hypothetical protein
MLDHDVGLPCILSYAIYTCTSHGYRSYAKSSNFEPVLYSTIHLNPSKSGILGASSPTTHILSDYYPVTAVLYLPWKEAAYLKLRAGL